MKIVRDRFDSTSHKHAFRSTYMMRINISYPKRGRMIAYL
ncbi:Uncharacterised protein [Vibrio cholerae]|nr:Uncharacterised protein [Vibrio cholerae]